MKSARMQRLVGYGAIALSIATSADDAQQRPRGSAAHPGEPIARSGVAALLRSRTTGARERRCGTAARSEPRSRIRPRTGACYNRFEQVLALANVATVLRPGGLLTNFMVPPQSSVEFSFPTETPVFADTAGNGDTMFSDRKPIHRTSDQLRHELAGRRREPHLASMEIVKCCTPDASLRELR